MEYDELMIRYECAMKVLETQLEIINDSYGKIKSYNPIEHIKSRLKSYDSIKNKIEKDGLDFNTNNVIEDINDVVGVRIICASLGDVYDLIKIIRSSNIIKVINEKDFITKPKESGYRSYHLIVLIPVEMIDNKYEVKAEIQIRTLAMDLWASLDHKLCYKSLYCDEYVEKQLAMISDKLQQIDEKMLDLIEYESRLRKNI